MQGVQTASQQAGPRGCRSLVRGWGWQGGTDSLIATFKEQHSSPASPASNICSVAAVSCEKACLQTLE